MIDWFIDWLPFNWRRGWLWKTSSGGHPRQDAGSGDMPFPKKQLCVQSQSENLRTAFFFFCKKLEFKSRSCKNINHVLIFFFQLILRKSSILYFINSNFLNLYHTLIKKYRGCLAVKVYYFAFGKWKNGLVWCVLRRCSLERETQ